MPPRHVHTDPPLLWLFFPFIAAVCLLAYAGVIGELWALAIMAGAWAVTVFIALLPDRHALRRHLASLDALDWWPITITATICICGAGVMMFKFGMVGPDWVPVIMLGPGMAAAATLLLYTRPATLKALNCWPIIAIAAVTASTIAAMLMFRAGMVGVGMTPLAAIMFVSWAASAIIPLVAAAQISPTLPKAPVARRHR